ncbi:hypothetical protein CIRG_04603 [Coccidioides immitis RMSCC 2394]|uniref:Uncharacterized protein n=1 Tax=Coccidioides immitis RMSCC 2394 TaxID=404692 RepID=A0A0J7B4T9_COCIT|nr:hypothetical protein CIRG_04603 [Coccidioides immitis RMSCC 2394]
MCGDSNDGTLAMKKNKKGQRSPVTEVEIAFQISSEKGTETLSKYHIVHQQRGDFQYAGTIYVQSEQISIHKLPGSPSHPPPCRLLRARGDATLSSPQFGDLLKTCYFFGPHRDPVIRSASNDNTLDTDTNTDTAVKASTPEIKVVGKWNSRTQYFTTFYGDSFQWRYIQCDDPRWNCKKLLVLESLENNSPDRIGRRVAQLVRNEHTRPQGASKSAAGNGGELLLDDRAIGVEVDEALVVATCLLMLKKEIDRRRMAEIAVFGIAAAC